MKGSCLFPAILLAVLQAASIQKQTNSLFVGDRIRITTEKTIAQPLIVDFVALRNDSLFVQAGRRIFALPKGRITRLEKAVGEKRNSGKGAVIGGLGLGLGMGLSAALNASANQDGWFTPTPGEAFMGFFLLGSLFGSITGAIIGSGSTSTQWMPINLDSLLISERPEEGMPQTQPTEEAESVAAKTTNSSEHAPPTDIRQEYVKTEPAKAAERKWSISFAFGTTGSGPADDIERAMRRDGFDDIMPDLFTSSPGIVHPFSTTGFGRIGFPWSLQLTYSANPSWGGSFIYSRAAIGGTCGYCATPYSIMDLNYYSTLISILIVHKTSQFVQFGCGPAVYRNSMNQLYSRQMQTINRFGLVVQCRLAYPSQTRFYIYLDFQGRWMPKANYGPFLSEGFSEAQPQLGAFNADFSHGFFGLGLGYRF